MAKRMSTEQRRTDIERDPIHEAAAEWFTRVQEPELSVDETASWRCGIPADRRSVARGGCDRGRRATGPRAVRSCNSDRRVGSGAGGSARASRTSQGLRLGHAGSYDRRGSNRLELGPDRLTRSTHTLNGSRRQSGRIDP
jgi:hypothetical protein